MSDLSRTLKDLTKAVTDAPEDPHLKLVLSDFYQEHGEDMGIANWQLLALKLRVKAGVSEMCYKIRDKRKNLWWGTRAGHGRCWGKEGKGWKDRQTPQRLLDHRTNWKGSTLDGVSCSDVEICLVEVKNIVVQSFPAHIMDDPTFG